MARTFMGNLGQYQLLTTVAKKVGGPVALLVITGISGWFVGRVTEAGGKEVVKVAKSKRTKRSAPIAASDQIFTVHTDGDATSELMLDVDNEFRVLERDKDAVLIEVLGNADNPYFVSSEILASLSDFPADEAAEGD